MQEKIEQGIIRLVNPDRGTCYCVNLYLSGERILSARTGAEGKDIFQKWDIYLVHNGIDFYCGRTFDHALRASEADRTELERWFSATTPAKEDLPQEDWLGSRNDYRVSARRS